MLDMRVSLYLTVLLAFFAMPISSLAGTSEYSMTLGVGEEYNSNVNDKNNGQADLVSKATAVGAFKYQASRLAVDGKIDGSFNIYALGHRNDEFKGSGQLNSKLTVSEELFFVEANGSFQQVYSNLIRGETNPTDSTRSQVNQYTTIGKVYLTPHLADRLAVKIGYDFTAYIYGDPQGTGTSNSATGNDTGTNKVVHSVYATTVYELTPVFQVTLDANALKQYSQKGGLERAYVNGGFRWQFSEEGYVYAKAGPRYSKYDNGASSLNPFVDAAISQKFGRFTTTASLSSMYTENPSATYSSLKNTAGMVLAWDAERLSLQARGSYSLTDGEDTQRSNQFSLGITAKYNLTSRLAISAGGAREATQTSNSFQVRWYANGGLTYDLGKDFSLEGYYRWKVAESTQGVNNNYTVNIVGLSLKKTF